MPERILVAEDKENLCRLIETTLSEQGYDVSIALGGDAAIHEIQEHIFDTFEQNVRDQLTRMLGAGGFDAGRDIRALTVNRWPHGYAYEYNSLWDPVWPEDQQPCVLGRKQFGRITIANSDAGAYAYTNGAIDQAYRAVSELLQPLPS
jgi:hypothetical protein